MCVIRRVASKSAIEDVQAQNLICILDVDIQGVKRIKETDLNPIYISIQPPSMDVLVNVPALVGRLIKRRPNISGVKRTRVCSPFLLRRNV